MQELSLLAVLSRGNLILASVNVIVAFSLLVYLLTHNLRNSVARAFCAVLAFMTVVYVGDVFLDRVDSREAALFWLRFQWLGIAFVPAAYLHFSDTLLRTTNAISRRRRALALAAYGVSFAFLVIVVTTEWLVTDGVFTPIAAHFAAGPLFGLFALYFFFAAGWGALNVLRARQRCLTSTSRRRMTYVLVSVAAPLSVFPYLIVAGRLVPPDRVPLLFALLVAAANVGIALMTVVMTYGVAYHGVLMPDRVVKRSLIRYLIEGPLLASCVVGLLLLIPPAERILGLPRDAFVGMAIIVGIVFFQVIFTLSRPLIDLLVYWGDWEEITWMRRLDERMLSSTDLRQLLENILTALCDLLRVKTGFVAVVSNGQLRLDTVCGSWTVASAFLEKLGGTQGDLEELVGTFQVPPNSSEFRRVPFIHQEGFWLVPLRGYNDRVTLGVLGVEGDPDELGPREQEAVMALVERAQLALEDRRLQQGVLGVLKQMAEEIETLQRIRSAVRYSGSPPLEVLESNPLLSPDFASWVKDALSHYWGGPRLTASPLLRLRIVRQALEENDYNPARAMRSVLDQAIERLRPEGQRSMTASEWTLYNILELRFIRGLRVGEVAKRLAISESDLYRKQRVAIDEVARQLASMEERQRD